MNALDLLPFLFGIATMFFGVVYFAILFRRRRGEPARTDSACDRRCVYPPAPHYRRNARIEGRCPYAS